MNEKNTKKTGIPFGALFKTCPVGSRFRPEYRLARADCDGNRELLEVGQVDLDEMVQSNYGSSFDAVLDRFLDTGDLPDAVMSVREDQDFLLDALDVASDYADMMETARRDYGMSADLSYAEIREQLVNKLSELNNNISDGGKDDEKTD